MGLSHTAAMINHLQGLTLSIDIAGISVPPVPPAGPYPYVIVREMAYTELEQLDGRADTGRSVMQVEVWDKDYEAAWQLREKIKDALIDFSESVGGIELTGPIGHNLDAELYNGDRELHELLTRFVVWFTSGG